MAQLNRSETQFKAQVAGKQRTIQGQSAIDLVLKRSDVKDWDDIELQHGRRRDKNGRMVGRPPSFIPKACHQELMRRYHARVEFMMTKALPEIMPELIAIAKGEKVAKQDQLRAMNIVIERTMGKVVESVQLTVNEQPWREALGAALVGTEAQAAEVIDVSSEIVDAEIVPDDEVDWEEA